MFTWLTPSFDSLPRAFHGSEVPFVFDNTDLCSPMTGGAADARDLGARISAAWVAFARRGNPNHSRLPRWPAVSATQTPTMMLDTPCELRVDHDTAAAKALAQSPTPA
jgi:para-nitrobenzyl esterase